MSWTYRVTVSVVVEADDENDAATLVANRFDGMLEVHGIPDVDVQEVDVPRLMETR